MGLLLQGNIDSSVNKSQNGAIHFAFNGWYWQRSPSPPPSCQKHKRFYQRRDAFIGLCSEDAGQKHSGVLPTRPSRTIPDPTSGPHPSSCHMKDGWWYFQCCRCENTVKTVLVVAEGEETLRGRLCILTGCFSEVFLMLCFSWGGRAPNKRPQISDVSSFWTAATVQKQVRKGRGLLWSVAIL